MEGLLGDDNLAHFIFLVDESGSVSDFFPKISEAVEETRAALSKQNGNNTYSLIQFASESRTVLKNVKITEKLEPLVQKSGGTDFLKAFQNVEVVMGSDTKPVQCVFFFTDGSADTSGIDKIFKSLRGFPRFRLIRLFTLGFGSGCNNNDL